MKWIVALVLIWAAWTFFKRSAAPKPVAVPDEAEARAVLGVAPDADADAIRAAHRRLLTGVHPDLGGSTELARRVNAARDVLLARR